MRTSRAARVGIFISLIAGGIAAYFLLWQPDWMFHWSDFRAGNEVISRVEAFQKNHGHLPETLEEARISDQDGKVFYSRISKDEYCVWFGTTLGESETFNSRIRKWDTANGGCARSK